VFRDVVLGGKPETVAGGQMLTEDSNGAVTEAVANTKGAISVIGFAYFNVPANKSRLNGLQLDGVDATLADMSNGSYKLAADGHLYTKGEASGLTADFLQFMKTDEVQKTIEPKDFYGSTGS
jgi:phosphate transport system substrate-binding protein